MPQKTQKLYTQSLFIFRRDLRLIDNLGLIAALEQSKSVALCFIFDPCQVDTTNQYRSNNAIQFMLEALQDLEQQCTQRNGTLFYFYGKTNDVIQNLIQTIRPQALFCNRDYTPFSIARDNGIQDLCNKHALAFHQYNDALLINPEVVLTKKQSPFVKFTAFYTATSQYKVTPPKKLSSGSFYTQVIAGSLSLQSIHSKILQTHNKQLHVRGGTRQGLSLLDIITSQQHYVRTHDFPAQPTSNLSAHLKFGCLSIRMVYHTICNALTRSHPLIRQLYWRDFFSYISFHYPYVFGHPFQKKYAQLPWSYNTDYFLAWCSGNTGFPIVDAGMRQLNTTGYMHNRVRMIVASFLTKDLHINWLEGERYFAQKLVDYDPALNNGNWQWCASTGSDAQPYFRIFNPWLQQKKFDPECQYIKQWVPELTSLSPKAIHTWHNPKIAPLPLYPKPIIDHAHETTITKRLFASFAKK